MTDSYEELARRLLDSEPEPGSAKRGRVTIDWNVGVLNGKPDLYLTVGCSPAMDQADIVALLRYEADGLDFDPAERAKTLGTDF
jgi:hypothetical protein